MATKNPAKAGMSKVSAGASPTLKAVNKETKKPVAAATIQKASAGKNSTPALTATTAKKFPTSMERVNAAGKPAQPSLASTVQKKKADLEKKVVANLAGGKSTGISTASKANRDPVITVKVGNKVPSSALPGTSI